MNDYDAHWQYLESPRALWVCIVLSILAHAAFGVWLIREIQLTPPKTVDISAHEFRVVQATPDPEPEQAVAEAAPPPPPPPPPPPEPKKEEPKPEPKPEPPPKPEPKKEEPKPEPKKEEKKPELKPEPKPEPPPPTPPKPKPEVEKKYTPKVPTQPAPEIVAKAPESSPGIQQDELPPLLNAWGRAVQRKVEKYWRVPPGISLVEDNLEVHLSFTVDRNGRIVDGPRIVKNARDVSLGEAGLQAIKTAEPLPPLPDNFDGERQEVIYVFSLAPATGEA